MKILGIESSCDETAAAVVEDGHKIISSVVATQIPFHEAYKGVVPEIASRKHTELDLTGCQNRFRGSRGELGIYRRYRRNKPSGADGLAAGGAYLCENPRMGMQQAFYCREPHAWAFVCGAS